MLPKSQIFGHNREDSIGCQYKESNLSVIIHKSSFSVQFFSYSRIEIIRKEEANSSRANRTNYVENELDVSCKHCQ